MKVLFGLPSYTGMWSGDVWTNIMAQTKENKVETLRKERQHIVRARDEISKFALDNKFDFLYMQDDDNIIEPWSVDKLISHNKDIISAPIKRRNQDEEVCIAKAVKDKKHPDITRYELLKEKEVKNKGLLKVDAVGFGAVLIKVSVLDELYKHYPNPYMQIVNSRTTQDEWTVYPISEDLSFCAKATKLGFECWCDCSIKTAHFGRQLAWEYNG